MTDTTMTTNDDPAAIEADIRRTQDDMSQTVDRIGDQMTLRNVFNALLDKADQNDVDARYLIEGARRNPMALGLIAAGAIWLVSDKDAKFPTISSGSSRSSNDSDDFDLGGHDIHHRDYVAHMSSVEWRDDEDEMAFQRRRDVARSNFLMCERRPTRTTTATGSGSTTRPNRSARSGARGSTRRATPRAMQRPQLGRRRAARPARRRRCTAAIRSSAESSLLRSARRSAPRCRSAGRSRRSSATRAHGRASWRASRRSRSPRSFARRRTSWSSRLTRSLSSPATRRSSKARRRAVSGRLEPRGRRAASRKRSSQFGSEDPLARQPQPSFGERRS